MKTTEFLTKAEILTVLDDLHHRAKRAFESKVNLILFRLSCCCGLRASEIGALEMRDLRAWSARPDVLVRRATTKGKQASRSVPLWWDRGTLLDLREWVRIREEMIVTGPVGRSPVIFSGRNGGKPLGRKKIALRWKTAIRILGPDRVRQLHCHSGRHSFITHALAAGRTLIEVQEAAGHSSIASTNVYVHYVESLRERSVPDLFE